MKVLIDTNSRVECEIISLVKIARHNEQWRQTYMTLERWKYYTEREGIRKGIQTGIQQQKAEDEKLLKKEREKNDVLLKRIAELEAKLAKDN